MGTRALNDLSAEFRYLIFQVLARLTERGEPVMIVETLRTMEEHQQNLANGTSRTALSKHLPRTLRGFAPTDPDAGKSDAIDICPYETYQIHGPDKLAWVEHATPESTIAFTNIGEVGEALGLRWGGRWKDPHDPGHIELVYVLPVGEGRVA